MITEKINELNKIYPHHAETKQQIRAVQALASQNNGISI